jgi:hypothetical protein
LQPVPHVPESYPVGERPLSALVDDVFRSARSVAAQSAELAKLELQVGLQRGALRVGVFLVGCVFLGILAALLWASLLGGVVWLAGERLGVPATLMVLWSLHVAAGVGAVRAVRARLAELREEPKE